MLILEIVIQQSYKHKFVKIGEFVHARNRLPASSILEQ